MKQTVFFFDLDGTLIRNGFELFDETEYIITNLQKQGHLIFVCTGRGDNYVPYKISSLIDGMITLSGARCIYQNKVLFDKSIDKNIINNLLIHLKNKNINLFIESNDAIFAIINDSEKDDDEKFMIDLCKKTFVSSDKAINYLTNEKIYKMDIRYRYKKIIVDLLKKELKELKINDASEGWLEISNKNISKGFAITELMHHLKIDVEKSVCFGDSENDLSMFETCGLSIAMGNSLENVKIAADYITGNSTEKGVLKALEFYNFI